MKTYVAAAMIVGYLAAASSAYAGERGATDGRYQLYNGKYEGLGISKKKQSEGYDATAVQGEKLFRIDSATGKTWVLEVRMIDAETTWRWIEVQEPRGHSSH